MTAAIPDKQFILLEGHTTFVRQLDFTLDGRWLATGSYDRLIKLWQIN